MSHFMGKLSWSPAWGVGWSTTRNGAENIRVIAEFTFACDAEQFIRTCYSDEQKWVFVFKLDDPDDRYYLEEVR